MRFTPLEKACIVAEYIRNQSVTRTQHWARANMREESPAPDTTIQWNTRFMEIANTSHRWVKGRPRTSEQIVEQVRSMLHDQPQLSTR